MSRCAERRISRLNESCRIALDGCALALTPRSPSLHPRSESTEGSLFLLRRGHHLLDVGEELPGVVHDAVLHHVLDAADALDGPGLVIHMDGAGAVEDLEVLQRI